MLCVRLATESNIKDVWNCQVFYKTISYSAKTKGIQTFLDYRKSSIGYFSRINILLMITVFKLQPQLFDYYLPQMRLFVLWLLFRPVESSNNIATLAEISSGFFVSRGDTLYIGPFREPTNTYGLRPKDHLFQTCIRKARGGALRI